MFGITMRPVILLSLCLVGCDSSGADSAPPDGSMSLVDLAAPPFDAGLRAHVVHCDNGGSTTISGLVNIPAGNLPLYGATVFVPNAPLDPIVHGASCNRCDEALSGDPVTRTSTDTSGRFTLRDVPVGTDIPLVIQAGKWRRQVSIPKVDACVDTPAPDVLTRMPRNQKEGELPRMAITTGGADALECLLRKLGIDDAEFTPESGSGRVHLYAGAGGTNRYRASLNNGAPFTAAPAFWDQLDNLKKYDMVIHSCEGTENPVNKSMQARQALKDYIDQGGRVFASHWHNYWVEHGPDPLPRVATFLHRPDLPNPITADIDMSLQRGADFASWMVNVGGSPAMMRGKVELRAAQNTVQSVNAAMAQRWIWIPSQNNVQYLSFNAPVGAGPGDQCGRLVLTDIHVSSGDKSSTNDRFPDGCTTMGLTAQEKALIFVLFDLANCLDPIIN